MHNHRNSPSRLFSVLLLTLCALLIFQSACAAGFVPTKEFAPKGPKITSQPQDVSAAQGSSCQFLISGSGYTGITWRFYDPQTGETLMFDEAQERFPTLKLGAKNAKKLFMSNIPPEMNGWMVFCALSKGKVRVISQYARLTVTDAKGEPLPGAREFLYDPTVAHIVNVKAAGAELYEINYKGTPQGEGTDSMTFEETAAFAVKAPSRTNQWYINGVLYKLNGKPDTIVIKDLTWDLTIGTLAGDVSEPEPEDSHIVKSKSARMRLADASGKVGGKWFNMFDFTDDYQDPVSGGTRTDGKVTVQVVSQVPNGQHINHWTFNGAVFDFDTRVSAFYVNDLDTSFSYETIYGWNKTPGTGDESPKDNDIYNDGTYRPGTIPGDWCIN